jgi:hypothetical protein
MKTRFGPDQWNHSVTARLQRSSHGPGGPKKGMKVGAEATALDWEPWNGEADTALDLLNP